MRKVTIHIAHRSKTFESRFEIEDHVPEYMVADEAYALAMRFAHTRMLAIYGRKLPFHKMGEFLKDLDYNYSIEEVK